MNQPSPPFDTLRLYESMQHFFQNNPNRIYRFWVYKRLFTPYENERKFMDETAFESNTASNGIVRELIPLPDGDVLLGIAEIIDEADELLDKYRHLSYYKLSEIRLSYYPSSEEEFGLTSVLPEVDN